MKEKFDKRITTVRDDIQESISIGLSDIVVMQMVLVHDIEDIMSDYYLGELDVNEMYALKKAIKDVIRKISMCLYLNKVDEIKPLDTFNQSIAYNIEHMND